MKLLVYDAPRCYYPRPTAGPDRAKAPQHLPVSTPWSAQNTGTHSARHVRMFSGMKNGEHAYDDVAADFDEHIAEDTL